MVLYLVRLQGVPANDGMSTGRSICPIGFGYRENDNVNINVEKKYLPIVLEQFPVNLFQ